MICLYRHFILSARVEGNHLSWGNYLETLVIMAFCSFAIGLYWHFKFRSRYLAAELEETRQLNDQLKKLQTTEAESQTAPQQTQITLEGSTNEHVTLDIADLLYIESVGNYVKVVSMHDDEVKTNMLRATMKQIEETVTGLSHDCPLPSCFPGEPRPGGANLLQFPRHAARNASWPRHHSRLAQQYQPKSGIICTQIRQSG